MYYLIARVNSDGTVSFRAPKGEWTHSRRKAEHFTTSASAVRELAIERTEFPDAELHAVLH